MTCGHSGQLIHFFVCNLHLLKNLLLTNTTKKKISYYRVACLYWNFFVVNYIKPCNWKCILLPFMWCFILNCQTRLKTSPSLIFYWSLKTCFYKFLTCDHFFLIKNILHFLCPPFSFLFFKKFWKYCISLNLKTIVEVLSFYFWSRNKKISKTEICRLQWISNIRKMPE